MSTVATAKRPEIKTSTLPGPRGQQIVADDAQFVTPSYPRPSFKLVAALVLAAVLFFVWQLIRRRRGRQPAAGGGGRM